ncbi:MAG: hypothetical protein AAFR74_08735 [Pseudomonadota bacterium]
MQISPEEFNEIIEELERWEAQLRALPPLPDDGEPTDLEEQDETTTPRSLKGGPS